MTQVIRIPIVDDAAPLEQRIVDVCEIRRIAGLRLISCVAVADQLVLVFQTSMLS